LTALTAGRPKCAEEAATSKSVIGAFSSFCRWKRPFIRRRRKRRRRRCASTYQLELLFDEVSRGSHIYHREGVELLEETATGLVFNHFREDPTRHPDQLPLRHALT
jgi:hypothetical protein